MTAAKNHQGSRIKDLQFQILSHAGLAVRSYGCELVCDPWIVGSTYWRSWWNYPPVSTELVRSLNPTFIYLTHIHWDHFQGVSLKRFSRDTRVIITRDNNPRMKDDIKRLGFQRIIELEHGRSLDLCPDFKISAYQFGFTPTDSAVVIESQGTVLLNVNDAKFMHWPLKQILKNHPSIDFVFRSHSSANNRLCYEIIDDPEESVDDIDTYISSFAAFAQRTGARFAIPFASNHCYLHRDTYRFNQYAQTPQMVEAYFQKHDIVEPVVKGMVSGDSWSRKEGFSLTNVDYFAQREQRIQQYAEQKKATLEKQDAIERHGKVNIKAMVKYFDELFAATPWPLRRLFKGNPIVYVFHSGAERMVYEVDLWRKTIIPRSEGTDEKCPIQIHTSAYIATRCLALRMFCHLSISKRVRYRVTQEKKHYLDRYENVLQLYEYGITPLGRVMTPCFMKMWMSRWRELVLYMVIFKDLLLRKEIKEINYI